MCEPNTLEILRPQQLTRKSLQISLHWHRRCFSCEESACLLEAEQNLHTKFNSCLVSLLFFLLTFSLYSSWVRWQHENGIRWRIMTKDLPNHFTLRALSAATIKFYWEFFLNIFVYLLWLSSQSREELDWVELRELSDICFGWHVYLGSDSTWRIIWIFNIVHCRSICAEMPKN